MDKELSASQQDEALWAQVGGSFLTQELVCMEVDEDSFEVELALAITPPPESKSRRNNRQDSISTTASTSTASTSVSSVLSRAPTRNSSMTTQSGDDTLVLSNTSLDTRKTSIRSSIAMPPKKREDYVRGAPDSLRKKPNPAASLPTPQSITPRVVRQPQDDRLPSLADQASRDTKRARLEPSSSSRQNAPAAITTPPTSARVRAPTTPAAPTPLQPPDFTPERRNHVPSKLTDPGQPRPVAAPIPGPSSSSHISKKMVQLLAQRTTPSKYTASVTTTSTIAASSSPAPASIPAAPAAVSSLPELDFVLGDTVHLPHELVAHGSYAAMPHVENVVADAATPR
ncbi:unnamed protein product [Peniophora sp. CBMAI 1063]|nr:unnamed protein product [Peniophora sp. CBMAI 1063]